MTGLADAEAVVAARLDPEPGPAEVALVVGAALWLGGTILGVASALAWARWWRLW